jgi:RHS repeat-associated protein
MQSYDSIMRLANVVSPAGSFGYAYHNFYYAGGDRVDQLNFGSSYIQNSYDYLARLTSTILNTPLQTPASQLQYGYDAGSQRTQQVFTAGNYVNYTYDPIGQLKTARGWEPDGTTPRLHEQFGYAYDAAWNLNQRTNNTLVQTFNVNTLNELTTSTNRGKLTVAGTATEPKGGYDYAGYPPGVTNVTVNTTNTSLYLDGMFAATNFTLANGNNTFTAIGKDTYGRRDTNSITVNLPATNNFSYDLNGNLRTNNTRIFDYDDENQLIRVTEPGQWKSEYDYDGMLRKRITREYTWQSSAWVKTNEVQYIYDGNLVIQERNANSQPLVTYTRGNDLSGSLQGAGGIGGLLARTDNGLMIGGSPLATAFYACDGNGNVTTLVYTNGMMAAQYAYDPFGNTLTMSGPLAAANTQRFSSKEWCGNAGLYYYVRRFYDPNLQRWLNRDPIQEFGGLNLYEYVENDPINNIDPLGLDDHVAGVVYNETSGIYPALKPKTNPGGVQNWDPASRNQLNEAREKIAEIANAGEKPLAAADMQDPSKLTPVEKAQWNDCENAAKSADSKKLPKENVFIWPSSDGKTPTHNPELKTADWPYTQSDKIDSVYGPFRVPVKVGDVPAGNNIYIFFYKNVK